MKKLILFLCLTLIPVPCFADAGFMGEVGIGNSAYGVIWNATADTYQIGTVTDGAFTEEAVSLFPIQEAMKRCILQDAGTVNYYLDASDSTKKSDGTTASVLDGTDGQVMVEIPKFYFVQAQSGVYRYFFISDGTFTLTLSDASTKTATIHPAFYKGGSATASDYSYIGAYEASMYDASASAIVTAVTADTDVYVAGDKMLSVSGYYPKTLETIAENRAMATARGTGWHQYDHASNAAIQILYITEYGDFNAQTKIGAGRTALSGGVWEAGSYVTTCGLSDSVGNATGNVSIGGVSYSTDYMSYRGIENWYGHVWKFVDGVNINNSTDAGSQLYACTDYTDYASDTVTGYTLSGSLGESDGYATDFLDAIGVYPASVGGSSDTFLCDYYYTSYDTVPDGGWRVVLVGGNAYSGTVAGPFCVSSNSGSTNAAARFGGRLCY